MRGEGDNDVVELGTHVLYHKNMSTAGNSTMVFRHTTSQQFDSVSVSSYLFRVFVLSDRCPSIPQMDNSAQTFVLDISAEKMKPEVCEPPSRLVCSY